MITISIADDLAEIFPQARVAFFTGRGQASGANADAIARRVAEDALTDIKKLNLDIDHLANTAPFSSWRHAFTKGGLQPSKYRSSVEALVRRNLRQDQPVSTGNVIVDVYNAISVKHLTPFGAYDIARLPEEQIELRLARGDSDRFSPVGAEPKQFPLKPGIPVYACGDEIICFGFNHRDSSVTACRDTSDDILFVAEIVGDEMLSGLQAGTAELCKALLELGMTTSPISFVSAGQSPTYQSDR